jgi:hypothetical protein
MGKNVSHMTTSGIHSNKILNLNLLSSSGDETYRWTDDASPLWIHFMCLCKECIETSSPGLSGLSLMPLTSELYMGLLIVSSSSGLYK